MPIYKYSCDNCGHEMELFMQADKESVSLQCRRCLNQVVGQQVRDDAVEFHQQDYVHGTIRHEKTGT